jgi:hypothetical protein
MKMNFLYKKNLLLLAGMFLSASGFSQNQFILSGKVTDNASYPLGLAKVMVKTSETGDTLADAYTDAGGNFAVTLNITVPSGIDPALVSGNWVGNIYPNPAGSNDENILTVPFSSEEFSGSSELLVFDYLGRTVQNGWLPAGNYLYRIQFNENNLSPVRKFTIARPGEYKFVLLDITSHKEVKLKSGINLSNKLTRVYLNTGLEDVESLYISIEKDGYITSGNSYTLNSPEGFYLDIKLDDAPFPTAAFSFSGELKKGSIVYFDASGSAGASGEELKFRWDFDNGQFGGGQKIPQIFSTNGTFEVKLTVLGNYNASKTITRYVTISNIENQPDTIEVYGRIFDESGHPLQGVTVSIVNTGFLSTTDNLGDAQLKGKIPSRDILLKFAKNGFLTQFLSVSIPDDSYTSYFEAYLQTGPEIYTMPDAELGGLKQGTNGTKITLPVEALVDNLGNVVTGGVEVSIKDADMSTESGFLGFPGSFAGITNEGMKDLILSYGASEISFTKDGEKLQLKDGKTAIVELPIFVTQHENGFLILPGDKIPFWSLNEETGIWVNEGMGTVVNSEKSPTGLALHFEVSHFSWWNCDVAPNPFRPTFYGSFTSTGGPSPNPPNNPVIFTVTGTPLNNNRPAGGPRSAPVSETGATLPVPPGTNILITGYTNNGIAKGEITINGNAGQTGIYIVPLEVMGRGTGGSLPCNSSFNASIDPAGEKDSWNFEGSKSDFVMITVESGVSSTLAGSVDLIAPSGKKTSLGSFNSQVKVRKLIELPETGMFNVLVDGTLNEPGSYSITRSCLKKLNTTEVMKDTLSVVDKIYGFAAQAGKKYNLAFQSSNLSQSIYFTVKDQSDNYLASGYVYRFGETSVFPVKTTGNYIVEITPYNAVGDYSISLNEVSPPVQVNPGEQLVLNDTIFKLGEHRFYSFRGHQNDALNFILKHPGNSILSAYFYVYEPKSSEEFYTPKSGNFAYTYTNTSYRENFTTPSLLDGERDLVIHVYSYSNQSDIAEYTGAYSVTVNKPSVKVISFDSNTTDTLNAGGFNYYRFAGNVNQVANLAFLGKSVNGIMYSMVYDINRQYVTSAGAAQYFSETQPFRLTRVDPYLIITYGYAGVSGEYSVGLANIEPPTDINLVVPTTTINNTISVLGDHQFYRFHANMNQAFNFILEHPTGNLNANMRVYKPDASAFFQAYSSIFATLSTNTSTRINDNPPSLIPESTDYIVDVYSYTGNESIYRLGDWKVTVNNPQPVQLTANSTTDNTISARSFKVFKFMGAIDRVVNLATAGTTLTNYISLQVYDSTRTYVRNTSLSTGFSETGVFRAGLNGNYYVLIDGYADAAGTFNIGFSEIESPQELNILNESNTTTGNISILGDHQFYKFNGTLNEAYSFVLDHPSGNLSAYIKVYEPESTSNFFVQGQTSFGVTNTYASLRINKINPQLISKTTGYVIEVYSYTGNTSERTGEYRIRTYKPNPVNLNLNSNNNLTLTNNGFHFFTFTGTPEMVVNLAHLGTTLSNYISLQIFNNLRAYVAGTSNSTNTFSETGPVLLTSSNTYYVIVNGYLDAVGNYILGFSQIETPAAVSISTLPVNVAGNISILGGYKFYQFDGTNGQNLNFTLSHPSGLLNAELRVFRPESSLSFYNMLLGTSFVGYLTTNQSTRSISTGSQTLPANSPYVIQVKSYTGNEFTQRTGAYNVNIQ